MKNATYQIIVYNVYNYPTPKPTLTVMQIQ